MEQYIVDNDIEISQLDLLSDDYFERADSLDDYNESISRPSKSYWQDVWRRIKKDPLTIGSIIVIAVIALSAIFLPMISPYTYDGQNIDIQNQSPTLAHIFGTDKFGRDIFIRILYGARISLTIGIVTAIISLAIGVIYGGVAGYCGGKVDSTMMRIVDILIGLPSLLYIILIMMFLGNTLQSILLALCLSSWIEIARIVRSQVISLKHQDYVLAAKIIGVSDLKILFTHLIPNSIGTIIVTVTFVIPSAIFSEAFLSFLGIGIQVPMASWGTLANEAIPNIFKYPYQMLFPALAISITMFALNFVGDGLRDALDPRLKK
ncbi:ABC transporter permease [uncultured Clostridium sp.]|uniref:ABC transporter permease n=1 Tax=uncultured Clostridium sp. TaxID=59620 RepID=UPI0027DD17B9|nr:ABC transporter permease [uncultured Clostridium sp.]